VQRKVALMSETRSATKVAMDERHQEWEQRLGAAEMLTARDLEKLLKIDVKTIYHYVSHGLIPYVRIQSNVRFLRSQIFDWIHEHNYQPDSSQPKRANLDTYDVSK